MDQATQAALKTLNDNVTAETTVVASVVTLLNGLSAKITALAASQSDPAVVAAINAAAAIVANDVATAAAAVSANTPNQVPNPNPNPNPNPAPTI